MNILKTAQTYKTQANAKKKLADELHDIGYTPEDTMVRWVIGAAENGRFAPIVILPAANDIRTDLMSLAHRGITVVG